MAAVVAPKLLIDLAIGPYCSSALATNDVLTESFAVTALTAGLAVAVTVMPAAFVVTPVLP